MSLLFKDAGFSTADYIMFKEGNRYYAVDGHTGKVLSTDQYADVPFNASVAELPYGGRIVLKPASYSLNDSMATGGKAVIIDGCGMGSYSDYVVRIIPRATSALSGKYCIDMGSTESTAAGAQIRNIVIESDLNNVCLGGLYFHSINKGIIENVYVNSFGRTDPSMIGIKLFGDAGRAPYYNIIKNCAARRCTTGLYIGYMCNGTTVIGGDYNSDYSANETKGIHIVDADTCTFLGSTDISLFDNTNSIGLYIEALTRHTIAHRFFGTRFESNYDDIVIAAGANSYKTGGNMFIGCSTSGNDNAVLTDNGDYKSHYHFISGFATRNEGAAANVADGGTIAHGLASTPTYVSIVGSVAGDLISVSALDASDITLNIKDEGGGVGTAQTIYWKAVYQP